MRPCDCCRLARENPGHCWFSPACLHCGARLIQAIGGLPIPATQVSQRRRAVLTDWMAHGHPEAEIRTLAALPERALAPLNPQADSIGQAAPKVSAPHRPTKRR
jgi:hypothetical protein